MNRKNYFFLSLLVLQLLSTFTFAGVLKGKIVDSKGLTLPYATIFIQGTTIGTSANSDGEYQFNLDPGTYKVVCQYIGFKQTAYNVTIKGAETVQHDFTLQDQSLDMKEVVVRVSSEDPAYPIIRKTIGKRRLHLQQVRSFQTGIYLKGVFRSRSLPDKILGQKIKAANIPGIDSAGKGVLYLCEEDADYYSDGDKERTVIHSVRESGNPSGFGFSRFPPVITYYENNVNLLGDGSRGFISPIADNALNFYKYKLEGEFTENGHTIYKIKVTPKRLYEPCFYGTIYIVSEDWAIHTIDMFLTKKSNLDLLDTLGVQQLFLPLKNDTWVAKNQVIYIAINVLGFDVTGSLVTVYDNQKVNEPIPDTIFNKKIVSSYDKTSNKKDTSYWSGVRPIPLEADENRNYHIKDSASVVMHSAKYLDSVRIARNVTHLTQLFLGNRSWSSKLYKNVYTLNTIMFDPGNYYENGMLNYNTLEGLSVAPKLDWAHRVDTGKTLHGVVAVRYGFHNTYLNSIAKLEYTDRDRELRGRRWTLGVQGGKYLFQYNPQNPIPPVFNSVSTLFWSENDLKLYERWEGTVYYKRQFGNGFNWDASLSYQQRLPLQNTTDYSFFKSHAYTFTDNLPDHLRAVTLWEKHNAVLAHIAASWQPGYEYVQFPDYKIGSSKWPVFSLSYDKGVPGILNSKVDFDKWRFSVEDDLQMKLFGSLAYNVAVGGFLNNKYVSLPDLMHLYGNRGIGFASAYMHSFQFAQYYDWSNKESIYGEVHLEYNMLGLLSNKIPLLRQARWYLLLGTNTFYSNGQDFYTEAFIGIDNLGWKIARILRIDFVQSWDSNMGRNSGIRFGIKTAGSSDTKTVLENDDW